MASTTELPTTCTNSAGYPSLTKLSLLSCVGAKKNCVPAKHIHVSICSGNGSSLAKNQRPSNCESTNLSTLDFVGSSLTFRYFIDSGLMDLNPASFWATF